MCMPRFVPQFLPRAPPETRPAPPAPPCQRITGGRPSLRARAASPGRCQGPPPFSAPSRSGRCRPAAWRLPCSFHCFCIAGVRPAPLPSRISEKFSPLYHRPACFARTLPVWPPLPEQRSIFPPQVPTAIGRSRFQPRARRCCCWCCHCGTEAATAPAFLRSAERRDFH